MDLSVSFYKQDADRIIAAFKKNDLNTVEAIHMKHENESGQMQVLLPAILQAGADAQKTPAFTLAVSEYVTFQTLKLDQNQRDFVRALRNNDFKTARLSHLAGADIGLIADKMASMPHSAAYKPLQAYLEQFMPSTPAQPLKATTKAKIPSLRVV